MTDSVAFLPQPFPSARLPLSLEPQIALTDSSPPSAVPPAPPEANIVWQILADDWHSHCVQAGQAGLEALIAKEFVSKPIAAISNGFKSGASRKDPHE